eukprot:TRINITY_DN121421_c0_g1_i1.p1 TRINITY_DN121421_c0_g1~~TRINITY_DN121421_c0_g1_i1.p1  ORF type:complete len:992 (-),score=217.82 TRINITY_DN121421_c0_g1_i1:121-3096(-)
MGNNSGLCRVITVLVIIVLLLLTAIGATFYGLAALFDGWPQGILATFAVLTWLLWLLLRTVARVLVFPGSSAYAVALKEAEYNKLYAGELKWTIVHLCKFLTLMKQNAGVATGMESPCDENAAAATPADADLEQGDRAKESEAIVGNNKKPPKLSFSMKKCCVSLPLLWDMKRNFSAQEEDRGSLTPQQQRLVKLVTEAADLLARINIVRNDATLAFPEFLKTAMSVDPTLCSFEGSADVQRCTQLLQELRGGDTPSGGVLADTVALLEESMRQPPPTWKSTLPFFRKSAPKPLLGSLAFMRAELQCRFDGVPLRIPSFGGCCDRIDAMLIPRPALAREGRAERLPSSALPRPPAKADIDFSQETVMIICGANAAYFESQVVIDDMLNEYLGMGFSVLLFNYRGFGRSSGIPNTWKVRKDGEAVVKYLKRNFGVKRFAIHGRSMGGFVACHVANKFPEVKLLFADRTFSSLIETASTAMGRWAAWAMVFVQFFASSYQNFGNMALAKSQKSKQYEEGYRKVLISDPHDAVICDVVSLRSAVAAQFLRRTTPAAERPKPKHGASAVAVSPEVLKAFLEAWDLILEIGLAPRVAVSSDDSAVQEGDQVLWVFSNDAIPKGCLLTVRQVSEKDACDGEGQTLSVMLPRGMTRFLKAEDVIKVSALQLLALQCINIVGALDSGGQTISDSLAEPMLQRHHLQKETSLRVWLDNLPVWGSRSARNSRAILAWKQRCLASPPTDSEANLLSLTRRRWDPECVYCDDCGRSMRSLTELARHADVRCGGEVCPPLKVGDRVECRARCGPWEVCTVTQLAPMEAQPLDMSCEPRTWDDVRPLLAEVRPLRGEDVHQHSLEQAVFQIDCASALLRQKAEELAALSVPSTEHVKVQTIQAKLPALQAFLGQLLRYFESRPTAPMDTNVLGHLIHCTCGHNGHLGPYAMEMLKMHVRESGLVTGSGKHAGPVNISGGKAAVATGGPVGGSQVTLNMTGDKGAA